MRTTCLLLLVSLLVSPSIAGSAGAKEDNAEQLRERSRTVVKEFATRLKDELMRAMSGGGPPAAITVCSERAPQIAAKLSREFGAKVGRTSLKTRNPLNTPEPWMHRVLEKFDAGGDGDAEFFAASPAKKIAARYMKAIPTQPMCLACHGQPEGEIAATLDKLYPYDHATGYEAGDIRGAFYVIWPETSHDRD